MGILDKVKSGQLLRKGRAAQEQKKLEDAYALYEQAAALGNADAMVAIGMLYMRHGFRPVKSANWLHTPGMPIFPWDIQEKMMPDTKTALSWYRKAADMGHTEALRYAGTMLCEGEYLPQNQETGLQYLDRAVAKGDALARMIRCLYSKPERKDVPDARYERWLTAFQQAVDKSSPDMYQLYEQLKSGSDAQLARLGYVLTTARNIDQKGYDRFKYLHADSGIPLVPACAKRGNWMSFVRIDLNAIASQETYLAFSSDIEVKYLLQHFHRLEQCGTVTYRSPAFGWLREEKTGALLRIAPDKPLSSDALADAVRNFCLIPEEYEPDNAAFFIENGEKEYSAEIVAITGDRVDVLFRYTIGGSDRVQKYFPPELVSITFTDQRSQP